MSWIGYDYLDMGWKWMRQTVHGFGWIFNAQKLAKHEWEWVGVAENEWKWV